ncbi:hypothetical protein GCM10028802_09450 [Terrabacter terrigena]
MTRGTIVWFVGSAVVGAAAGVLHLLRSELGGAHTGVPLAVGAFGLTVLAAAMLFHGIVLAAREQDAAAGPVRRDDDVDAAAATRDESVEPVAPTETAQTAETAEAAEAVEAPAVYTFRAGKPVSSPPRRPAKRDRPSRS